MANPPLPPPAAASAVRQFGRFELRLMLGRSLASSTWLAWDPRLKQEVNLCVPRARPASQAERDEWTQEVLSASRLNHPRLAEVLEVGSHDGWPFVCSGRHGGSTLVERLQQGNPATPTEAATWLSDLLEGLAYAHEAGVVHLDIGLHTVVIDRSGRALLAGMGAGLTVATPSQPRLERGRSTLRPNAERDVLMCGLLLHRLLANHPALDDADLVSASTRVGPEIVRLPWSTPHPVEETLRAIVNRATDRQQRQRYLGARTLLSALQGWLKTHGEGSSGPLALLLDRLNSVGALPGRPNSERLLVHALSADTMRVDDFVEVIIKNPTLVWELLRQVNAASFRSSGDAEGASTLSRAVLMLGQQGMRKVSGSIRPWPGALGAQASRAADGGSSALAALDGELRLACLAGHVARLMAPFSINDEEACVAAMSQRLAWLLMLYHFPDESAQIQRLTQPGPPLQAGGQPVPGMTQEAAAAAVLGINLDDLTSAVLRHWGLPERLVQAARPVPVTKPVRTPIEVEDILRTVASLGNELVQTSLQVDPTKAVSARLQVQSRYGRALGLGSKECEQTLEHATRLVDAPMLEPVSEPGRG